MIVEVNRNFSLEASQYSAALGDEGTRRQPERSGRFSEDDAENHSVVVVEDNPADIRLLTEALDHSGVRAQYHFFDHGYKARLALMAWQERHTPIPDLIVLDINLPGTNGLELLELIRGIRHFDDIKVAMLTSSSRPADRARAMALGANRYIVKPFDFEQIAAVGEALKSLLHG